VSAEGAGPSDPYRDLLASGPPESRPETPSDASGETADSPSDAASAAPPAVTVVLPGDLSLRPYPGVPTADVETDLPEARTPPRVRPRYGRYHALAAVMFFGVGILGVMLFLAADSLATTWEAEVTMPEPTTLDLPAGQTRWVWVPEDHTEDVACTARDSDGADLRMSVAGGRTHEDYDPAFSFPTGSGTVTLTCDRAPDSADPGWQAQGRTVWVGPPQEQTYVPFLQTALLLFVGGPAIGVVVFVTALLVQIVRGVAALVRPSTRVNVNTATAAQLAELPGVGGAIADRILTWRNTYGPFPTAEALSQVPGIGPAKLRRLRRRVDV